MQQRYRVWLLSTHVVIWLTCILPQQNMGSCHKPPMLVHTLRSIYRFAVAVATVAASTRTGPRSPDGSSAESAL